MNDYKLAVDELFSKNTLVNSNYFKLNHYYLESAYSELLQGNLKVANSYFSVIDSPRSLWAMRLIKLFLDDKSDVPTYFQIRNFLEIDMNLFILKNKEEYIKKMFDNAKLFYQINSESYKFFARVLMNNNLYNEAKVYIENSKKEFYNDPELHYMDMLYYFHNKDYKLALKSVENCLKIIPEYYPAKRAKEKLIKLY